MSKRNHRATGPRTTAGKAVSSQNARTHGLTAATLHTDVAGEIPENIPALTDIARFAKRTAIRKGLRDSQSDATDIDRELALLATEIRLSKSQMEAVSSL